MKECDDWKYKKKNSINELRSHSFNERSFFFFNLTLESHMKEYIKIELVSFKGNV